MKKVYILLFVLSLGMIFCSGCSSEMEGEEAIVLRLSQPDLILA